MLLLITLVVLSWGMSWLYSKTAHQRSADFIIAIAVIMNISALAIWKYGDSLVTLWNSAGFIPVNPPGLLMPLGISFYVFQQCGYLLDLRKGRAAHTGLLRYAAFITFFPQLLAGPIVTQRRMSKEFAKLEKGISLDTRLNMGVLGLGWLSMGLFKKVVIADSLGRIVTPHFSQWVIGELSFGQAWQIALSSPTRVYFDFCGYSEMAVGLGLLCGVKLPANFNAPFRSNTLRQFWSRWHITFHHFIRDHIFGPLMRRTKGWRGGMAFSLFIAITLSSLWHGNSLQFFIWGIFIWMSMFLTTGLFSIVPQILRPALVVLITIIFFVFMGILFIAPNLEAAQDIYMALFTASEATLGGGPSAYGHWVFIIGMFIFVRYEISTQQLLGGARDAREREFFSLRPPEYAPNLYWIGLFMVMFVISLYCVGLSPPFVYFQF